MKSTICIQPVYEENEEEEILDKRELGRYSSKYHECQGKL